MRETLIPMITAALLLAPPASAQEDPVDPPPAVDPQQLETALQDAAEAQGLGREAAWVLKVGETRAF